MLTETSAPAPITTHYRRYETQSSPCRQASSCASLASSPRATIQDTHSFINPSERTSCFGSPAVTRSPHSGFDTLSTLSSGHCGTLLADSSASVLTDSPPKDTLRSLSKPLMICQPKLLEVLMIRPGVTIPPWAARAYWRHYKSQNKPPRGIARVSHHPYRIPARGLAADYAPLPPIPKPPLLRAADPETLVSIPPLSLDEAHSAPTMSISTASPSSITPFSPSFVIRHSFDTSTISDYSSAHTVSFVIEESFESSSLVSHTLTTSFPACTQPSIAEVAAAAGEQGFFARCASTIASVASHAVAWVRSWFS